MKKQYIVKLSNETYLTFPTASPWSNYYEDHANPYERIRAFTFSNWLQAKIVALLTNGVVVRMDGPPIRYEQGKTYETIGGDPFYIDQCKDETVCDRTGNHRYNRTNSAWDAGRRTGSKNSVDDLKYPPVELDTWPRD